MPVGGCRLAVSGAEADDREPGGARFDNGRRRVHGAKGLDAAIDGIGSLIIDPVIDNRNGRRKLGRFEHHFGDRGTIIELKNGIIKIDITVSTDVGGITYGNRRFLVRFIDGHSANEAKRGIGVLVWFRCFILKDFGHEIATEHAGHQICS